MNFEDWWEKSGQFSRAGGGGYEKTFAFYAWHAALAEHRASLGSPEAFIVKQYDLDGPIVKGNGFDGLRIGEDRAEAQDFIAWVNRALLIPEDE